MAVSEGVLKFPGLKDYQSFSFSFGHGITPSVCSVTCGPGDFTPDQGRTLTLSWESTTITFRDCKVDKAEVDTAQSGLQTMQLSILDRRWKWRDAPGQISGVYNVRTEEPTGVPAAPGSIPAAQGVKFVAGTERTPQQLAILCLKAMGETRYNVTKLPNNDRPQVEWEYAEPADELARLCEQYGCHVVLKLDNSIDIVVVGQGKQLPINVYTESASDGLDPPERPDKLILVCDRTQHQMDLELEAVGEDRDGLLKQWSSLSYYPLLRNGFLVIDHPYYANIPDKRTKELARKSIFKYYRVKVPFTIPAITPGGPAIRVTALRQILPLLNHQVQLKIAAVGTPPALVKEELREPWVYGVWSKNGETNVINAPDPKNLDIGSTTKAIENGRYTESFSIDEERGVVMFDDAVFRMIPPRRAGDPLTFTSASGRTEVSYVPAVLWLRIAINVRDAASLAYFHYERTRVMPGLKFNTQPRYVKNQQQGLKFVTTFKAGPGGTIAVDKTMHNQKEVDKFAKIFLDAEQAKYQITNPLSRTYGGFYAIDLDGAIQQVIWHRGADGYAHTTASRDTEQIVVNPSYKERRKVEIEQATVEMSGGTRPPAKVQTASFSLGKVTG